MPLIAYQLGLIEYQRAWNIQNRLAEEVAAQRHPPAVLLLEHPHVYTFGRQGKVENLLWDQVELQRRGVTVHHTDRGGDVTYHGPGQLVAYPVLQLENRGTAANPQRDLVGYLRKLELALIELLLAWGIPGSRVPGQTGIWLQPDVLERFPALPAEKYTTPAKIASIGVRVNARGITSHGFALNVNPDMGYWEGIIACGLENQNQVSMALLLGETPEMEKVAQEAASRLARVLGLPLEWAKTSPPGA